ncbi:MAG: dihydrodipicolinate synthase family protein [Desulfovibrio sp.]|jgi:4-hydroxy-tetrahydrodipicolinate synthase|nr:dihydrodipicolinate synthase family protein [Desulfovibrio sp.]
MIKYITPTLTALHNDHEIDVDSCLKLYDNLIANEIDGVAIFGSSGEFPHIALSEKKKLVKAAVPYINKRMQCLIGTGGLCASECIELSNYALEQGADGVMAVSPYYFVLSDESIVSFFSKVATEVKGAIYIYNFPDRTGYSIKPETVLQLAQKHHNIVGIKDTIPDVGHTVELIKTVKSSLPDFEVYSGYDNNFAYNVLSGGNGCIAALSNIRPDICSAWVKSVKSKNFESVQRYQQIFDRLMKVYSFSNPFMAAMKSVLVDKGIFVNDAVTFPYLTLDKSKKQEVRDFLKSF